MAAWDVIALVRRRPDELGRAGTRETFSFFLCGVNVLCNQPLCTFGALEDFQTLEKESSTERVFAFSHYLRRSVPKVLDTCIPPNRSIDGTEP